MEVPERKSNLLSLGNPGNAEIKPSLVVVVAHKVGRAVSRHPQVNLILLLASASLSQVAGAEVGADDDLAVGDLVDRARGVLIQCCWLRLQTTAHSESARLPARLL